MSRLLTLRVWKGPVQGRSICIDANNEGQSCLLPITTLAVTATDVHHWHLNRLLNVTGRLNNYQAG